MSKGRWIGLTENRRLVLDVCAMSRHIPLFPAERTMDLASVRRARSCTRTRISWTSIFTKSLAVVGLTEPLLRRSYVRWPWPHLYEHAFSTASIAIQREVNDEDRLCWGKITRIEDKSLVEIQAEIDHYASGIPAEKFPKQTRLSRLPKPIRWLAWQMGWSISGRQRAKSLGTFTVSSLSGLGVYNRFHPTVLTSSLSYGPIDDDGSCIVTLICDHRVIDGYRAAVCMNKLEDVLNGEILEELNGLRGYSNMERAA